MSEDEGAAFRLEGHPDSGIASANSDWMICDNKVLGRNTVTHLIHRLVASHSWHMFNRGGIPVHKTAN